SRFSPLLTPRLLMSARPRAMLSLMQFSLPRVGSQNAVTT
ncbi:hypothetical protein HMPREF1608_05103, partial [Escherichia coli 908525]